MKVCGFRVSEVPETGSKNEVLGRFGFGSEKGLERWNMVWSEEWFGGWWVWRLIWWMVWVWRKEWFVGLGFGV